ncbi:MULTISPECIES: hypothetical protein [unclassified Bosea (in: a-proteobacteria)]|uniref:hypothetical protein n=1 Tax=unclassified Bosea (in: a-proteobacteria) TaxID=2653178 RepID=UPI000F7F3993|nr:MULTISPECIES: hypothetical protein [unclassified Bosea (in: a-proteobacteria)]
MTILLGLLLIPADAAPLPAQALTPDPGAWRPLAYSDLQRPTPRNATYADIWKDQIDANNAAYRARGDRRFVDANAPATEAHFVIWSAKRSVVLSILNTALGCKEKARDRNAAIVVKLCPMRVAIYDGLQVRTMEAGQACFIEPVPETTLNPKMAAAYGAYDVASKTLKLGLVVSHQAPDGCSFNVPLGRE